MSEKPQLSVAELSTLWFTYEEKTFILRFLEYLIPNAEDPQANKIMTDLYGNLQTYIQKVKTLFKSEGGTVPV